RRRGRTAQEFHTSTSAELPDTPVCADSDEYSYTSAKIGLSRLDAAWRWATMLGPSIRRCPTERHATLPRTQALRPHHQRPGDGYCGRTHQARAPGPPS